MPCTNIITPTGTAPAFVDRYGFSHPVYYFEPVGTIKGTIFLLYGGIKVGTSPPEYYTKGFDSTTTNLTMNFDECHFLYELVRNEQWRCLMFKNNERTKVGVTNAVNNEWWIEDLAGWMNTNYPGGVGRFFCGHSAGAYIVGLHIHHIQTGQANGIWGNAILSFPEAVGSATNKTNFVTSTFNGKNTVLVSGKSGSDTIGYQNTLDIKNIACPSSGKTAREVINGDHEVFKVFAISGLRVCTEIVNRFFQNYPTASLYCDPSSIACEKCGFTESHSTIFLLVTVLIWIYQCIHPIHKMHHWFFHATPKIFSMILEYCCY